MPHRSTVTVLSYWKPTNDKRTVRFEYEHGLRVSQCTIFPKHQRMFDSLLWHHHLKHGCTCSGSRIWMPMNRRPAVKRWKVGHLLGNCSITNAVSLVGLSGSLTQLWMRNIRELYSDRSRGNISEHSRLDLPGYKCRLVSVAGLNLN